MILDSFFSIFNNLIRLLVGIVSVPITIGYLGNDRYGVWMLVMSTLTFISFLDLGVTPILKNLMAEARARGDYEKELFYKSNCLLLTITISILIIPTSTIIYSINWIVLLDILNPILKEEILPLILTVQIILFLTLAFSTVDSIYAASLRIGRLKLYDCAGSIVSFIFLILSVKLNLSLPLIVLLTSISPVLIRGTLFVNMILKCPDLILFNYSKSYVLLREIIQSSIFFMGIQLLAVVLSAAPNLLISHFLGLTSVAYFSVVMRLVNVPLNIVSALLPVFWPRFTQAWTNKNIPWLRSKMLSACGWTCLSFTAFSVILVCYGEGLIYQWTAGKISVERSVLILSCIWLIIQGCVNWMSTFLHSITDLKFEAFCYGTTAFVFLLSSYFTTPLYGLMGVASSMTIALSIGSLFPMIWRLKTKLG